MPDLEALARKRRSLVRKALGGVVFIASAQAARIPDATTFTTGAGADLRALPADFVDGGYISDDGVPISRDISTSDISAWGETEPVRTDFTGDTSSAAITFIETNRTTIQLYTGATDEDLTPDATTGEVSFAKPEPGARAVQAIIIGVDRTPYGNIYVGRYWPAADISDFDDQTFASGDDPLAWALTLTAKKDDTLGYSERFFFGGPGWKHYLAEAGFAAEGATT